MNEHDTQSIAAYIKPLGRVPMASPSDTLGSALSKIRNSHESIFVFEQKKFLGIISPHHVFFRARLPHTTRCQSALITPPRLTAESNIKDVARAMLTYKTYILPVFDDEKKPTAKITADSLLNGVMKNKKVMTHVIDTIRIKKPITLP